LSGLEFDATAPVAGSPSGKSTAPQSFAPEDLVAGRYRIVRFIAQGGMGEVYEAEDLELRERVALKTVRADIADSAAVERFKLEIQLARKVTHENVCRIFDVGFHRAGEASGEITFLTMELLPGDTLSERIRAGGPLPAGAALPLVAQMATALDAAHRAGVVHRDFKSANVMLVPTGEGGHRVVVTDFGLARPSSQPVSETMSGSVVGSPAYMSPEQVEGGNVTVASDIYSLGVVVFEMVTGQLPFSGPTPISTAIKRLTEPPPAPRSLRPDLPERWQAAILTALSVAPKQRFPSATELVKALSPPRRRRRAGLLFAAVGLLALIAALAVVLFARRGPTRAERPSIAVVGFRDPSARPDAVWLSTALAEMITSELDAGERLRLVSVDDVALAKLELGIADAERMEKVTLARLGENLDADYVVAGTYVLRGDKLRIDVRLQRADTSEIAAAVAEEGPEAELGAIVSRIGQRLRERLGVGDDATSSEESRLAVPSGPQARRRYAQGLDSLRQLDYTAARVALEEVVALEPGFPFAHAALSLALAELSYDDRSRQEAKLAFDLSTATGLGRQSRMLLEARYRESIGDFAAAIKIYRDLHEFFPDSLEYGLHLVDALSSDRRSDEALATLEDLRRRLPRAAGDPRIDMSEARAAMNGWDYKRMQVAAQRAVDRGRAAGSRLLVAEATYYLGKAYESQNQLDGALAAAEEARRIFAEVGHLNGEAKSLSIIGFVKSRTGDVAGAVECVNGRLKIFRELGSRNSEAYALDELASGLLDLGDLRGAREQNEAAINIYREQNNTHWVGVALAQRAIIQLESADLDGAAASAREALASVDTASRRTWAYLKGIWGDVLFERGEIALAKAELEEALKVREDLKLPRALAQNRVQLAEIALVQGDRAEAERLALAARAGLEPGSAEDIHGSITLLLARAATDPARARELAGQALIASRSKSANTSLEVEALLVVAERGGPDMSAVRAAALALAERFEKEGFLIRAMEARQAVARADGDLSKLEELARAAEARGLRSLAVRARVR
jgi:eukaryotic-like serine/threonine-protein kinase